MGSHMPPRSELVGIGLALQRYNGGVYVHEVIVGGPASRCPDEVLAGRAEARVDHGARLQAGEHHVGAVALVEGLVSDSSSPGPERTSRLLGDSEAERMVKPAWLA